MLSHKNLAFRPAPVRSPPQPSHAAPILERVENALSLAPPLSNTKKNPGSTRQARLRTEFRSGSASFNRRSQSTPFLSAVNAIGLGQRDASVLTPGLPIQPGLTNEMMNIPSLIRNTRPIPAQDLHLRRSARTRRNMTERILPTVSFSNLVHRPAPKATASGVKLFNADVVKKKNGVRKIEGVQKKALKNDKANQRVKRDIRDIIESNERKSRGDTNRLLRMLTEDGKLTHDGYSILSSELLDAEIGYAFFGSGLDEFTKTTYKDYGNWCAINHSATNAPKDHILRPSIPVLLRAFFESFHDLYSQKRNNTLDRKFCEGEQENNREIQAMRDFFFTRAKVDFASALWEHFRTYAHR